MKTFFKFTLSLITLVFTVVLVGFFWVINMDPNEHKDWIAGQIRESSGFEVDFNGNIGLTFYPWLGITLDDFVVQNAEGFSDTPLLQSERAEFRVKLVPLLSREYEIDTIRLRGTRIHLETNAAGQANWSTSAPAATPDDQSATGTPALNNLVIGGVDIQDAALTFDDRFNGVRYDVDSINISTGELVYGEPLSLSLGLNARATQPAVGAAINLTGTILYDLDNERYELNPLTLDGTLTGANVPNGSADITMTTAVIVDLGEDTLMLSDFSLSALDARIDANINGRDIASDAPLYAVNLTAAGNDLSVLFRILENDDLVNQITGMDSQSFEISGLVEASPAAGNVTVTGLNASLLDATITGNVSASNLHGDPVINGEINASGPDLPTLLEVAGQFQGGRDSELARYGRELQQSPDQSFLVNTRFDADLQTGNISVPALEIRVLGNTISGNIDASNVLSDTPVARGRLTASGQDLPLMLQIAGQLTGGRESALNTYGRQLRTVSTRSFNINAPFDVDMATGNMDLSGLDASFLGFNLSGNLQARNFQAAAGTMSARLILTGRNLREVLTAVDQPDLAEVVQSLNLELVLDGTRSNLAVNPLNLGLVLSGPRIPNSPVTLALSSNSVLNLENDSLETRAFNLTGLGLDLSGSLQANNISENITYNGRVSLPQFNLRSFMQQLNQPLPPTADDTVFQAFALNTAFAGSADDLRLSTLDLTLDESRITGDFSVAGFSTSSIPAVDFDLDITDINLDRYLAPETDTPAGSETTNTELPLEALRNLNLNGELDVGQLTYANLKLQNVALAVNAADGELALEPLTASLYEGSYRGGIRLDARSDMPVASIDTALTGINLAPLLRDFMDASYVSGTGNIELALTGSGADTATIKRSLNGTGSLDLQDGVLQGVDVGGVLTQVESMIREQRVRTIARGERTPFESFSATINVANGIVSTNDLLIDSSGFAVTGRGTLANLTNDSIAFNLTASVDENPATDERAYDIGGYDLPIACTGTFTSPTCLPDIQAIIAGGIQSAVQRGLTNLLERAVGNPTSQESQGDTTAPAEEQQEEEEQRDPREELLNRALENLFNR